MKAITEEAIKQAVKKIYRRSLTSLPADIVEALEGAWGRESQPVAREAIGVILENARLAAEKDFVVCQDTGIPQFLVRWGTEVRVTGQVVRAIREAVMEVTAEVPLIPHTVDALKGDNAGNNTGTGVPIVRYSIDSGGGCLQITSVPVSGHCTACPVQHLPYPEDIPGFVAGVASRSGAACPPFIIGVGIGGPYENAMLLAREAVSRPLQTRHPVWSGLEEKILGEVNRVGMGPMNFGGDVTALAVNVEISDTHTGCIPVAVMVECWCVRRASARIYADGRVELC